MVSTQWYDSTDGLVESFGKWRLRQDVLYLDNGAFGACPAEVMESQEVIRQKIEENPHDFFERNYVPAWEASRNALARFLRVEPANLVIVPGATHGLNIVIQSLRLKAGDEILTTNHAYSSVILALDCVTERDGARLVTVDIPLHVTGPGDVLGRILARVTPKTRFAVVDHIPSRSGLVFPIKEIVRQLAALDIDTLVDGAHAAGMLDLDVTDINAAYYVANCHKWMCAPRGVGFLHVRPDRAHHIKPLVVACSPYVVHKTRYSRLEHSFGWLGTSCPSAVLTLPACIGFLNTVIPGGGGLGALVARNHNLAVAARRIVCAALGIPRPCPDSMIGAMATIPLPDSLGPEQEGMLPVQQILWKEHKIVVPVYSWPAHPKRVVRLSAQAYNSLEQYMAFADCLRSVLYEEQNPLPRSLEPKRPLRPCRQSAQRGELAECTSSAVCGHQKNGSDHVTDHAETPHQDIHDPDPQTLFWLAKARLRRMAAGRFATYPVAPYPTAGDGLVQFAAASRAMAFMLSRVDRRRLPQIMAAPVSELLEAEDVIQSWTHVASALKREGQMLGRSIVAEMAAPRTPATLSSDIQDAFVSRVVPYETERLEENLSLTFWRRALADFTTRGRWLPERIASFLQIHAFLKDPVGGLLGADSAAGQAEVFAILFASLQPEMAAMALGSAGWEDMAAQLALESSFISQPLVRHPSYVHFTGDQQLVYAYVDMRELARSEFACPRIVVGMIENMMASGMEDECTIAPIAVAQGYPVCFSGRDDSRPIVIIIDGNNRITTITFLRFVSRHGIPDPAEAEEALRAYCRDHGLGPIQSVDLMAVLRLLWKDRKDMVDRLIQAASQKKLAPFTEVRQVPVLVTEESTFVTESRMHAKGGGKEGDVLQPLHQSIFATDEMLVALPSKMQSHGRAKGFKALPIRH
ncbi:putative isopenicillin N epimerase [Chaetomidium leptoderma]|uniref:Isopenicillin N epimerase n=1 Tax=Chaetomidium leptoderma TaxID=669021 RepID=A0AAN6VD02_9PEZI|nr:putative isopenicillin N epimerase [Chaetomidium leptoderma]